VHRDISLHVRSVSRLDRPRTVRSRLRSQTPALNSIAATFGALLLRLQSPHPLMRETNCRADAILFKNWRNKLVVGSGTLARGDGFPASTTLHPERVPGGDVGVGPVGQSLGVDVVTTFPRVATDLLGPRLSVIHLAHDSQLSAGRARGRVRRHLLSICRWLPSRCRRVRMPGPPLPLDVRRGS
jgi:hypothetical protein